MATMRVVINSGKETSMAAGTLASDRLIRKETFTGSPVSPHRINYSENGV